MDNETKKILTEAEELKIGVIGNFWQIVKARFIKQIVATNDIMNLDIDSPNLATQVLVNQQVCRVLIEILREIEGEAQSVEDYHQAFNQEKQDEYLKVLEA